MITENGAGVVLHELRAEHCLIRIDTTECRIVSEDTEFIQVKLITNHLVLTALEAKPHM